MELILTLSITITILLPIKLLVKKYVDTRALVPVLHNFTETLGGPALRAAGYPQKRGPLPPTTVGRGRLPSKWACPREGAGPKLPWRYAGSQCRKFLDTARRGWAEAAMVRLVMSIKDVIYVNGKGKINIITITLTFVFIPLLPHTISLRNLAADAMNVRGQ